MDEKKAMTVRLTILQAEELEAIADVDKRPVSEEIRDAIAAHIEAKKKDKEFQSRLKTSLEKNRSILNRLSK